MATPPVNPIRVLCVDDLPEVTAVMRMIVEAQADMQCVGTLSSANDLIGTVRDLNAQVVLLDATMPGKPPLEAMQHLRHELPEVRSIVYSAHDDQAFSDQVMDAGAWGCVSKNDPPHTIVEAVREVAAGNMYFRNQR